MGRIAMLAGGEDIAATMSKRIERQIAAEHCEKPQPTNLLCVNRQGQGLELFS